jgi:hypothetical protein
LRAGGLGAWWTFLKGWPRHEIASLIEVYLSFFLVVAWSIKHAGDVQSTRVERLQDELPQVTRYFAVGIIPLREWFEPSTVVYLATIIRHQIEQPAFAHERVLLFKRQRDLQALSVSYLDEPYAKSFVSVHRRFGIPLSYLPPGGYVELMNTLSEEERRALGCHRATMSWLRTRVPRLPQAWTIGEIEPFALVERLDGTSGVLRFDKHGQTLTLTPVRDQTVVAAAKKLVDGVTRMVHSDYQTKRLHEHCNFSSYLEN